MSGSALSTFRFSVVRSFKAYDDGTRKKFVLTALARNLPPDLPLEANARLPNIIKNTACREMRRTLLTKPEDFQILNGGIICAASSVEVKQEGNEHIVEVRFDDQGGIINGGHTYGQLLHMLLGDTTYSREKDIAGVLALDVDEDKQLAAIAADSARLDAAVARAKEKAQVQIEIISPVTDRGLLVEISTARNRSQPVEETGFQNLEGRFDPLKEVLRKAKAPFGPSFYERVVWKPNQEVPEDSKEIPVKLLIQLLAMMNIARYPEDKPANEVYTRAGVVVREFGDPSDEENAMYQALVPLLPTLIQLYEHIYASLPDANASFPWADGKEPEAGKKKRTSITPFFQKPVAKVAVPFIWPIFASLRCLLEKRADGTLVFKHEPMKFFDEMRDELAKPVISFFNRVKVLTQVGRDKEVWVRLDSLVAGEVTTRKRLAKA